MTEKKLHEDLERLRAEVDRAAQEAAAAKKELNDIINDLEKRIAEPADNAHHRDLLSNIRKAIERFETEHPRATAILNDIMVTLSNMGI